jgi:hypothetical protein
LIDDLLKRYEPNEEMPFGKKGFVKEWTKRLVEPALSVELTRAPATAISKSLIHRFLLAFSAGMCLGPMERLASSAG